MSGKWASRLRMNRRDGKLVHQTTNESLENILSSGKSNCKRVFMCMLNR